VCSVYGISLGAHFIAGNSELADLEFCFFRPPTEIARNRVSIFRRQEAIRTASIPYRIVYRILRADMFFDVSFSPSGNTRARFVRHRSSRACAETRITASQLYSVRRVTFFSLTRNVEDSRRDCAETRRCSRGYRTSLVFVFAQQREEGKERRVLRVTHSCFSLHACARCVTERDLGLVSGEISPSLLRALQDGEASMMPRGSMHSRTMNEAVMAAGAALPCADQVPQERFRGAAS